VAVERKARPPGRARRRWTARRRPVGGGRGVVGRAGPQRTDRFAGKGIAATDRRAEVRSGLHSGRDHLGSRAVDGGVRPSWMRALKSRGLRLHRHPGNRAIRAGRSGPGRRWDRRRAPRGCRGSGNRRGRGRRMGRRGGGGGRLSWRLGGGDHRSRGRGGGRRRDRDVSRGGLRRWERRMQRVDRATVGQRLLGHWRRRRYVVSGR
jgi:hypothetical protein